MRLIKTAYLACAASLAIHTASAETLTDTLVSAYNNSNILELNRAALRTADEDVALAVAALRPIIEYSASRSYAWDLDTDPTFAGSSTRETAQSFSDTIQMTASMALYEFGRNRLSVKAARQAVLAARQNLLAQEQDVLFAAATAYTEVRRAQSFVALRSNNVDVLREELRAANDRFDVGEVTRTDVAQAEARLASAEANLVSARGDLEIAREAFKLAVGRYPGTLAPPPAFTMVPASLAAAQSAGVTNHPALKQQQYLVAAQELNVEIATREVLPTVALSGSAGFSNQSSQTNDLEAQSSLSLSISGPLYQGGRLNALYRRAVAVLDQNRANLLQTTRSVEERVGFGWANFEVATASLRASERQIEAAEVAFEGTREEATLGSRTTLDVLNAEQELLDARGARLDALSVQQDAYYFMLSTMGMLTAASLGLNVVAYDADAYANAVDGAPTVFTNEQGIRLNKVLKSLGKQ